MDDSSTHIERSGVNMPMIVTIGVISVLLLIIAVYLTEGYFAFKQQQEMDRKNKLYTPVELTELRHSQEQNLAGGFWVEKGQTAATPIRQAMASYAASQGHTVPQNWEDRGIYESSWNPPAVTSEDPAITPSTSGGDVSHPTTQPAAH